jgi:hypothetical protein
MACIIILSRYDPRCCDALLEWRQLKIAARISARFVVDADLLGSALSPQRASSGMAARGAPGGPETAGAHRGARSRPRWRSGSGRHGADPRGRGAREIRGSTPGKADCPCTSAGGVERGQGAGTSAGHQKYFDSIPHSQLRDFLDQRVTDGVIRRMIDKWLKAGKSPTCSAPDTLRAWP